MYTHPPGIPPEEAARRARINALADRHLDVAVALRLAAHGQPDRLLAAPWRGRLDEHIETAIRDLEG